jgi:hypothetical protein
MKKAASKCLFLYRGKRFVFLVIMLLSTAAFCQEYEIQKVKFNDLYRQQELAKASINVDSAYLGAEYRKDYVANVFDSSLDTLNKSYIISTGYVQSINSYSSYNLGIRYGTSLNSQDFMELFNKDRFTSGIEAGYKVSF